MKIQILEYGYNQHTIQVEEYLDYVGSEDEETGTFYAISIDNEYLDHGYITIQQARSAAEDFIDGDLQNL